MLMMLALSGFHAQRGQLMRMMLALSSSPPRKGPTDAHDACVDARLVEFSAPQRGQLMLMMLALSSPHAQQGAN